MRQLIAFSCAEDLGDTGSRPCRTAVPNASRKVLAALAILCLPDAAESFDVEAALRETAKHINRTTPRPLGDIATLEGAVAYETTLKYKISFKDYRKEEISSEFVWKQTEFLTDFVCMTPEMQVFVENKVTLKYAYYGKEGKLVEIITVDTRKCGRD